MKDLSDKIIQSIESQAVKPVSPRQYAAKKILFWSGAVLLSLFGALALALAMYLVQSIDWNMYSMLGYRSIFIFIISAFPYAFILLLIAFLVLAYFSYRQTPKGHKVKVLVLAGILIIFGLSMAFMLHILGVNREAYLQIGRMPFYHRMMFTKETQWSQPDKGLLWGEVLNVDGDSFSLRDMAGKNWKILYDNSTLFDGNIYATQGQDVKIVGQRNGMDNFQAKQVQRWDGIMNCNGHRNMMQGVNGGGMMRSGGMMNWR